MEKHVRCALSQSWYEHLSLKMVFLVDQKYMYILGEVSVSVKNPTGTVHKLVHKRRTCTGIPLSRLAIGTAPLFLMFPRVIYGVDYGVDYLWS